MVRSATIDIYRAGGLTETEVTSARQAFGYNELPEAKSTGPGRIFLRQFKSPFIYVLCAAAVVSLLLGQRLNAQFIFLVLLINATIGTVQEYSAQRAAEALKKLVPLLARVRRDGQVHALPVRELVPGDLVLLTSGDRVPADLNLLHARNLQLDESMLTGESIPAIKSSNGDDGELLETSLCYTGTVVNRGRGLGVVTD